MFHDITGIEFNSGFRSGVLEILTPSYNGTANRDFWRGTFAGRNANSNDPFTLSNTLPMDKSTYEEVRSHIEELKRLVVDTKRRVIVEGSAPARPISDELERLASLHQQGVLDEKEFVAVKARLLGLTD
jgi:hypothetical protein